MSEYVFGPDKKVLQTPPVGAADTYAVALGKTPEEIQGMIDSGMLPLLENDAIKVTSQNTDTRLQREVERLATEQPEDAVDQLQRAVNLSPDAVTAAPDYAAMSRADKMSVRLTTNEAYFDRAVQARMANRSEGGWATAGYFLDTAVSSVVQNIVGTVGQVVGVGEGTFEGGFKLAELAEEINLLMIADIPVEEYKQRVEDVLDRIEDAGLFSEVNPFYLTTFQEMVKEGGRGPQSKFEQAFALLDLTPVALAKLPKLSATPGSAARNVSKVTKSLDKGVDTVLRTLDDNVRVEGTSPSIIAPGRVDQGFTGPELLARRAAEESNTVLSRVREVMRGATTITKAELDRITPRIVEETRRSFETFSKHELDVKPVQYDTGIVRGVAVLGKRDGTKYTLTPNGERSATKLANNVGGRVVEEADGYVVVKEVDVPYDFKPTDIDKVASSVFARFASSMTRTTPELQGMLTRGEAAGSALVRDIKKTLEKTSKKADVLTVDRIVHRLRDDPKYNWRTEPLTGEEFKKQYYGMTKEMPSSETLEYYRALQEVSDVDYFLTADTILKQAIQNKEKMLVYSDQTYRVREVTELPLNEKVWFENGGTRNVIDAEEALKSKYPIYEVFDAGIKKNLGGEDFSVRYIMGPDLVTRRMYHSDVLGYNAGGHRMYADKLKYFVKQGGRIAQTLGKNIVDLTPTTFMGVRTYKEAAIAKEQINNIVDAINSGVKNIDEVISKNNDWNPSVSSLDDWNKFAEERGLDPLAKVDFAEDKGRLVDEGPMWAGLNTNSEAFLKTYSDSQRGRGHRPLIGFGGEQLTTLEPSNAISFGAQRSATRAANQRYMSNSVNGWMNAAKALNILEEVPAPGKSRMQQFMDAKIKKGVDPKLVKQFENERVTIQFRMAAVGEEDLTYQSLMHDAAEWVYGKGMPKLAKVMDNFAEADPLGKLRAIAFHTKLGMFNPDHLLVQAAQLNNIVGIASGSIGLPRTMRAMSSVPAIRVGLIADDNLLRTVAKRQAATSGISEEDFVGLVNYLKTSGRNIVDNTVVEENNAYAKFAGRWTKFLDYGQVFFREGELVARLGAAAIDVTERRLKYGPDVDIFADKDAMFRRQDILTASMTSASAAPWQRSMASIPFQFMTYNVRMMEQLFVKDILTPKEKFSLGVTHLALYGGAALPGVGYALDRLQYEDPNAISNADWLQDAVRYGLVDATVGGLLGETAGSTRYAIGEGLWDFFYAFTSEDTIVEAAIGPGGQIASDLVLDSFRAVSNLLQGNFDYAGYDWLRFARNISSVNKAENIRTALMYGEYYNRKTLTANAVNMTTPDVFALALGIPKEEYDRAWSSINIQLRDSRALKREARDIQGQFNLAIQALEQEKDAEKFQRILNDVGARLELMSVSERDRVWLQIKRNTSLVESVIDNAIRNGNTEFAIKMQEMIDGV